MKRTNRPLQLPNAYRVHYNWRDEQEFWRKTAVFFDQSYHMADHYFEGPDVRRLLEDVAHMDYRFSQTARYKGCACHIARTPFRVRLR